MASHCVFSQFVSAEQSVDGHISASPGIWPMADCYIVLCTRTLSTLDTCPLSLQGEGYMSLSPKGKATCLLPLKGEGYMSPVPQRGRLHVSCPSKGKATCPLSPKGEGYMSPVPQRGRVTRLEMDDLIPRQFVPSRTQSPGYEEWMTRRRMTSYPGSLSPPIPNHLGMRNG